MEPFTDTEISKRMFIAECSRGEALHYLYRMRSLERAREDLGEQEKKISEPMSPFTEQEIEYVMDRRHNNRGQALMHLHRQSNIKKWRAFHHPMMHAKKCQEPKKKWYDDRGVSAQESKAFPGKCIPAHGDGVKNFMIQAAAANAQPWLTVDLSNIEIRIQDHYDHWTRFNDPKDQTKTQNTSKMSEPIEYRTYVNGVHAEKLGKGDHITNITNANNEIKALEGLDIKSVYVAQRIAKHKAVIKLSIELLDEGLAAPKAKAKVKAKKAKK